MYLLYPIRPFIPLYWSCISCIRPYVPLFFCINTVSPVSYTFLYSSVLILYLLYPYVPLFFRINPISIVSYTSLYSSVSYLYLSVSYIYIYIPLCFCIKPVLPCILFPVSYTSLYFSCKFCILQGVIWSRLQDNVCITNNLYINLSQSSSDSTPHPPIILRGTWFSFYCRNYIRSL